MSTLGRHILQWFCLLAAWVVIAYLAGGLTAALAAACVFQGASLLVYWLQLGKLLRWLQNPKLRLVPQSWGVWDEVFQILLAQAKSRKKRKQKLGVALQRFNRAIEAMPNGVLILTHEGRIEWMNRLAAEHLNLNPERDWGGILPNLLRAPEFHHFLRQPLGSDPLTLKLALPDRQQRLRTFTITRLAFESRAELLVTRDISATEQLNATRTAFVANVSHELRTPLTLISGPVEHVLANTTLPDDAREQLLVVERNTNRMLRLINQILDFRKIQNRKMKMQVQRVNVVAFTRKIMESFDAMAEEHRIDFLFETEKEELYLWVDVDKYEKIVFNLLSNAFKYTPDGKMITVFVREEEKSVSVGVEDQGIGIAENKKKSIFLRFENLVDRGLFNQSSTGIGLSLVKELVEMHKAVISVDSKLGEGSCFKVDFLKGKEHYDDGVEFLQDDAAARVEMAGLVMDADEAVHSHTAEQEELQEQEDEEAAVDKETMLLVEDNSELRLFLRTVFASEFRVVEAVDGVQGMSKALKFLPDIIISDVMMPEKDGISMTRDLRADMTTSHIPIVLLTAKTSMESKVEGLEFGADDYITKPFSATYLKARVKNLLIQRRKLQELYRADLISSGTAASSLTAEGAEEQKAPELSPNDRKFMDKLRELMEKNMDNGDLVVDDLVQELAVSRSVFFKKLKTLTGLAPIEFIKEMRINRAVQLIETGEYTMTQISYMVGINDPRYFSKCFKQKMGMTPTEYRDRGKNG